MRKKTNVKETTFGTVTVFEDDLQYISDEKLFKKEEIKKNDKDQLNSNSLKQSFHDIDTSLSIESKKEPHTNGFFDDHFFGPHFENQKNDSKLKISIEENNYHSMPISTNTEELNFIDDLYFGSSENKSSYNEETIHSKNITTEEIRKDKKLNYIGEDFFLKIN